MIHDPIRNHLCGHLLVERLFLVVGLLLPCHDRLHNCKRAFGAVAPGGHFGLVPMQPRIKSDPVPDRVGSRAESEPGQKPGGETAKRATK
jgi:hypothetical protein